MKRTFIAPNKYIQGPNQLGNIKKFSATYDMSTMLSITNPYGNEYDFIEPQSVVKGQSVIK